MNQLPAGAARTCTAIRGPYRNKNPVALIRIRSRFGRFRAVFRSNVRPECLVLAIRENTANIPPAIANEAQELPLLDLSDEAAASLPVLDLTAGASAEDPYDATKLFIKGRLKRLKPFSGFSTFDLFSGFVGI